MYKNKVYKITQQFICCTKSCRNFAQKYFEFFLARKFSQIFTLFAKMCKFAKNAKKTKSAKMQKKS